LGRRLARHARDRRRSGLDLGDTRPPARLPPGLIRSGHRRRGRHRARHRGGRAAPAAQGSRGLPVTRPHRRSAFS
jgi:hypothetical protein